jgi:hypothetical protein
MMAYLLWMFVSRKILRCGRILILLAALISGSVLSNQGQSLNLPARATNAPNGLDFTNIITTLSETEREDWIYAQVISGNIPGWQRTLVPVTATRGGHTVNYYVAPDYLAIGSDTNYFLEPTTPLLAQQLADRLGCTLPTRLMVNEIWTNSTVKLAPQPIPPSSSMSTVPIFAEENFLVATQRNTFTTSHPLGALVSGDKKDEVISPLIYNDLQSGVPSPVVIYGWINTDGSPIQPLFNGHASSYMDYSHGVRLVQMNLTVDGAPNTVTNVLASPSLAFLLSDETEFTGNAIPVPRYTVAPMAPVVMTHPRNQTVTNGQNAVFSTLAIGDLPLSYLWKLNGTPLPGATNASLVLSNVQPASAGSYSVTVTNATGSVTSRAAVLRLKTSNFPVLFADNFDTNSTGNWNIFWSAANGVPDYTVNFNFNYGVIPYTFNGVTALIPPAPNSPDGNTFGLKLTVNDGDTVMANVGLSLYPKNFSVSGNYSLKFDLWINYPGNSGGILSTGSTQFATSGLNFTGTNVNWDTTATASDGLWFAVDGDGGAAADYRAYLGNPTGTPFNLTGSPAASGLLASNHTASVFQNLFPSPNSETPGTPGKSWTEVEIRQTNNVLAWLMNGVTVATRTNSSAFTNGTIMLGLMDVFPSIANPARDCFVLFDNVRVENLAPPISFQNIQRGTNGTITLTLNSALGDIFNLERATNLFNWQPLASVAMTNNPFIYVDGTAPASATIFYRARR